MGAAFFDEWHARASHCRLKPVVEAAEMFRNQLLASSLGLNISITSAVAEGVNGRIQAPKSAARGFRDFASDRIRIAFVCGKLRFKREIH